VFTATTSGDTAHIHISPATVLPPAGVGSALPTLTVTVLDQFNNPIVGDVVTWNGAITGGGTVSATTSTTDITGTARTTWTLGARVGTQSLQAVEGAKSTSTSFTSTATVTFSDVFAGNFMACGIVATNNNAYCWGVGDGGQLGKGTTTNASAPTWPVTQTDSTTGYLQVRQISGGDDGFCALTIDRRLFCWGRTIGVSSTNSNNATFQTIVTGSSSQQILPNFIGMGEQHVCILDLTGLGFCTGSDLHGELGDSTKGVSPSVGTYPFILHSPVQGWSRIVAGTAHTCGIPRLDLTHPLTSQRPLCWGLNTTGQVGNDSTSGNLGQQAPTLVTMPVGVTAFDSLTLTAGAQHTCAIEASGSATPGAAWCWGGNGFGQLGSGTATVGAIDSIPTPVQGGHLFTRIYAGAYHTCGIEMVTGAAYCWGRNDYGQLGGVTPPSAFLTGTAAPVAVTGGLRFRSLSVGELYTCGLTGTVDTAGGPSAGAGTVYCWGDNLFGQIGNETTGNNQPVLRPTKVHFQP